MSFAIPHPDYEAALRRIERIHKLKLEKGIVQNLCIFGSTGAGKSTVFEEYAERYPRLSLKHGMHVPVLVVTVPARPTTKVFMTSMLRELGAPSPEFGTSTSQYTRFLQLAKDCGVELVIFDEVQHFIDRGSAKTLSAVADNIKLMSKAMKVPFILAGAPRASILLAENSQLRRLFTQRLRLKPFSMTHQFNGLRGFIHSAATVFELPEPTILSCEDVSERIFYATDGLPAHIITFLQTLQLDLESRGATSWTLADLSAAFKDALWTEAPEEVNPFVVSEKTFLRRLNQVGEPYFPSPLDGDHHNPRDGLNGGGDSPDGSIGGAR